jgi:hypothetical protein
VHQQYRQLNDGGPGPSYMDEVCNFQPADDLTVYFGNISSGGEGNGGVMQIVGKATRWREAGKPQAKGKRRASEFYAFLSASGLWAASAPVLSLTTRYSGLSGEAAT